MATITFQDRSDSRTPTGDASEISAAIVNEIKNVVNQNDSESIKNTGDQNINGVKSFMDQLAVGTNTPDADAKLEVVSDSSDVSSYIFRFKRSDGLNAAVLRSDLLFVLAGGIRIGSNQSFSCNGTGARIFMASGGSSSGNIEVDNETSSGADRDIVIKAGGEVQLTTGGTEGLRVDGNQDTHFNGVAYLNSYTVATLPAATTEAGLIYVSDESGGPVLAFSDGSNWRRVTDRAVVS